MKRATYIEQNVKTTEKFGGSNIFCYSLSLRFSPAITSSFLYTVRAGVFKIGLSLHSAMGGRIVFFTPLLHCLRNPKILLPSKCQTNVRQIIWHKKDFLRNFAPDLVIFKNIS